VFHLRLWYSLIVWQSHHQGVHFHPYEETIWLNFFCYTSLLGIYLFKKASICNFQIIFYFRVGIIELLVQKVINCMQGAMKLACPYIITGHKRIFVFTFIIIEWLHYCFLGFLHYFKYLAYSCSSFPIHQKKYMNKRNHDFESKYNMIPKWRHKNNFCSFPPFRFLRQLVLAPFVFLRFSFSWYNLCNDRRGSKPFNLMSYQFPLICILSQQNRGTKWL